MNAVCNLFTASFRFFSLFCHVCQGLRPGRLGSQAPMLRSGVLDTHDYIVIKKIERKITMNSINSELLADLRNKLQASYIVIEQLSQGKPVPENLVNLAKNNIAEIEKLLSALEGLKLVQSKNYERSL